MTPDIRAAPGGPAWFAVAVKALAHLSCAARRLLARRPAGQVVRRGNRACARSLARPGSSVPTALAPLWYPWRLDDAPPRRARPQVPVTRSSGPRQVTVGSAAAVTALDSATVTSYTVSKERTVSVLRLC